MSNELIKRELEKFQPTENEEFRVHMVDAYRVAMASPDPSTQNGAVLVTDGGDIRAIGNNHPIDGIELTEERLQRPRKYAYMVHAEEALIHKMARTGKVTQGLTMVCPWAPCPGCARDIVGSGIRRLVVHEQRMLQTVDAWAEEVSWGIEILHNGGVELLKYVHPMGYRVSHPDVPYNQLSLAIRVNGALWHP